MPPKRKRRQTEAWKKLKRDFKRSQKRVHPKRKRRKRDETPFTNFEDSKIVQLIDERDFNPKQIIVVMFSDRFEELGLKDGQTQTMCPNALTEAGRALFPALKALSHNDMVLKNTKEIRLAGKCMVFGGKAVNPNATIKIKRLIVPLLEF